MLGLLSLILFLIVLATASNTLRRRAYPIFFKAHFLVIPATFLAMLHSSIVFYCALPALSIHLLNFIYMMATRTKTTLTLQNFTNNNHNDENNNIQTSTLTPYMYLTFPSTYPYKSHPTQHLALSFSRFSLCSHPFTLATSSSLLVRTTGPFTHRLQTLASSQGGQVDLWLSAPIGPRLFPQTPRTLAIVAGSCVSAGLAVLSGRSGASMVWITRVVEVGVRFEGMDLSIMRTCGNGEGSGGVSGKHEVNVGDVFRQRVRASEGSLFVYIVRITLYPYYLCFRIQLSNLE
jgi:hypothetical protein